MADRATPLGGASTHAASVTLGAGRIFIVGSSYNLLPVAGARHCEVPDRRAHGGGTLGALRSPRMTNHPVLAIVLVLLACSHSEPPPPRAGYAGHQEDGEVVSPAP